MNTTIDPRTVGADTPGATTKITVKIWRPLIAALDKKLDSACLRRDAYLAKLLNTEVPLLDNEVSLRNSGQAHAFISERLDAMDRKLVSIALDAEIVQKLQDVCVRKNIVRDAFFNRLYLLLAAAPKYIDQLLFPDEDNWRAAVWSEYKHEGPFFESGFYPLNEPVDPFWAIRAGLEHFYAHTATDEYEVPDLGTRVKVVRSLTGEVEPLPGLHNILFEQKTADGADLLGLNCYMPDWSIPGHAAQRRHTVALEEFLGSLK